MADKSPKDPVQPSRPYRGDGPDSGTSSWEDLQAKFLQYASEHAELSAVWTWNYPGDVIALAVAKAASVNIHPFDVLRGLYENTQEVQPPAPTGQWTFDGGSPSSTDLFRVIAGRAAAKFPNPLGTAPWQLWLDRMREEGYAAEIPARSQSGQLVGPYPKGYEDRRIQNVFMLSAEFCRVRALAECYLNKADKAHEKDVTPRGQTTDQITGSGSPWGTEAIASSPRNLTEEQRNRIRAAEKDLDESLKAHERMRLLVEPQGWQRVSQSSAAPTMAREVPQFEGDIKKYVIAILDILSEASWEAGSMETFRAAIESDARAILDRLLARVNEKDLPLLDTAAIENAVSERVRSWIRKAAKESPPSWLQQPPEPDRAANIQERSRTEAKKAIADAVPNATSTSAESELPSRRTPMKHWFRSGDAILSLQKPGGSVFEGLAAHLTPETILVLDVADPIERGDMLVRTLSSGLRVGFIVDDPGYRPSIGSIQEHFEVKAHRAAPIEGLERSEFWRICRTLFEELSSRQRAELGVDQEHQRWLRGFCSHLYDELANGDVLGGLDAELRSKFEDVATQSAMALGCPPNADPLEFWTSCLCLDLLQNSPGGYTRELLQPVIDGGFIVDMLGSSAAYCSRLAAKADRRASENLATPEQDVRASEAADHDSEHLSFHKAPEFVYKYPDDFPASGQLAIENARREANRQLEGKGVISYDEHRAARVEWFWQVVSVAATTIGEGGTTQQWGANRRREMLYDLSLKAAEAVSIAGPNRRQFERLTECTRWRALDDCLFEPSVLSLVDALSGPSDPMADVVPKSTTGKRGRGRPAVIPPEAKQKALEAKRNGAKGKEIAQLVYSTKRPTDRQVKDAPIVLKNYERSLKRTKKY